MNAEQWKSDYTEGVYVGEGLKEKSQEYCKENNIHTLPDGGGTFAPITKEKVREWARTSAINIKNILT